VEEVGVLSGKYMEELKKALKIGPNNLCIELATMRIIVLRIDSCSWIYFAHSSGICSEQCKSEVAQILISAIDNFLCSIKTHYRLMAA
jgi:hypothetical protein